jgi:hypothetical protein
MDFAQHYCGYSVPFPPYPTALISRLENPAHRRDLLANFTEEACQDQSGELEKLRHRGMEPDWILAIHHPQLSRCFRQATIRAIAVDFSVTSTSRADPAKGMHKALALGNSFRNSLDQRALERPSAIQ